MRCLQCFKATTEDVCLHCGRQAAIPTAEVGCTDVAEGLLAALTDVDEASAHSLARGKVLVRLVVPELAARLDEQLVVDLQHHAGAEVRGGGKCILKDDDFPFIDDIVAGVLGALRTPPAADKPPHRVFNLGNHHAEPLTKLIALIEKATGKVAKQIHEPMQMGDVKSTFADIEPARAAFGFEPRTNIEDGVPKFVAWYRDFYGA